MNGLIVVDMQSNFKGSLDPEVRKNVEDLVRRFREEEKPIFIVEYDEGDPTHYDLASYLCSYNEVYWVRKNDDDGSSWVHHLVQKVRPDLKDFVICGVNASFCVYETARGLINCGYNLVLPEEATTNAPDQLKEFSYFGPRGLVPLETLAKSEPSKFKIYPMMEVMGTDDLSEVVNL